MQRQTWPRFSRMMLHCAALRIVQEALTPTGSLPLERAKRQRKTALAFNDEQHAYDRQNYPSVKYIETNRRAGAARQGRGEKKPCLGLPVVMSGRFSRATNRGRLCKLGPMTKGCQNDCVQRNRRGRIPRTGHGGPENRGASAAASSFFHSDRQNR